MNRGVQLLVVALVVAACAQTDAGSEHTSTTVAAETTTTSPLATTTSTLVAETDQDTIDEALAMVVAYFEAAADRDLAGATLNMSEDVSFDWGPADGPENLETAWAWEDAFTLRHTLEECIAVENEPPPDITVRCRLFVESDVAAAAGNDPGYVCVDVDVSNGTIVEVVGLDSADGCRLNYWIYTFMPFESWLDKAHPEITLRQMYDDRMSADGLQLWADYTKEYLADTQGSG